MTFLEKLARKTHEMTERAAQAVADAHDRITVPSEIREERYSTCKQCEHFVKVTTTCLKCGCFTATKTYLANAECPIGKWPMIQITPVKE